MRLLVITYYWPPAGGPSVQRWLKTSHELQKIGAEIEILTVDQKFATYPLIDNSLIEETNNLKVHKTFSPNWFKIYQLLTRRKEIPFSGFANQAGTPGPIQKISRIIRGNFFLPDPRRSWNRYAIKKAIKLHKSQPFDAIITTGPPHSSHLIGKSLKKKIVFSWYADFRDPWTDIYYYEQFYPSFIARWYDKALEKSVIKNADGLFAVSRDLIRILKNKAPNIDPKKFIEIPNGYDPNDFSSTKRKIKNESYTIVYTGTLTLDYPIQLLYKSLKKIIEKPNNHLTLKIAGRPAKECIDYLSEMDKQFGNFEFIYSGYLSHKKSVQLLESADCLLLLIPNIKENKGILTGKIFEYIGSGKVIWGFGPEKGDAQEILTDCNAGSIFENYESATDTLQRYINEDTSGANLENREKYTRAELAKMILSRIIKDSEKKG